MNSSLLVRLTAPACLAFAFIVTATPDAFAQGSALSTNAARDLYQKANDAAARKDWAESRRLFLDLWKRSPTYDVASGLGQAEFKLGHHAVGARYMALAVANMPVKENLDSRFSIEDTLKGMKAKVGTVHLSVDKDGAEIRTDGEVQGTTPLPVDLFFEPGPHVIEAKIGEARASKSLEVAAGQTYTLELPLPSAAPAAIPLAASPMPVVGSGVDEPTRESVRGVEPRTIALWTGVGVTAVVTGLGVVFALKGSAADNDANRFASQVRSEQGHSCANRSESPACGQLVNSLDERDSANKVAIGAFVGGGVAAVATASMFLFWPTHERRSASVPRLSFSLAPHLSAASVTGTF
ncbi:MAG: hypothetical protein ABI488_22310 [Polyangiaceae bacterium]